MSSSLQNQFPVMLMTVVESHGASPGKAGFAMAVAANGERCGTIGGGAMEVKWVGQSLTLLAEESRTPIVRKLFHSRETTQESSGLICAGSQTILLKPLYPDSLKTVAEIANTFVEHLFGMLRITPDEFGIKHELRNGEDTSFTYNAAHDWIFEQNVGVLDTVYVIGSGHVGLALSRIMSTLDFRVVVIDDRADAATFVDNCFAHQRIHSSYDEIGKFLCGNERKYVAIVTTAYKCDEAALKAIISLNAKYIGLMGSAAKTKQIFEDLKNDGFTEDQLKRIHTPIGIPIESETPEEIAVSIAAEIIMVKNESA